jgi:hypothetical protein
MAGDFWMGLAAWGVVIVAVAAAWLVWMAMKRLDSWRDQRRDQRRIRRRGRWLVEASDAEIEQRLQQATPEQMERLLSEVLKTREPGYGPRVSVN